MALEYLAWDLLFGDERVIILERRLERRLLRDAQNPFELPQREFMCNFRLTQQMAMELADELRPHLERERMHGLSTEIQVLVAVQFFACGSYQRPTGNQYNLNVSQPVVSRCIRKVTLLMNRLLLRQWVKFPMTPASRELARNRFRDAPQPFEGAIGAIDCTFVHILAPKEHEEAYPQ